jgi:hypothetical protein
VGEDRGGREEVDAFGVVESDEGSSALDEQAPAKAEEEEQRDHSEGQEGEDGKEAQAVTHLLIVQGERGGLRDARGEIGRWLDEMAVGKRPRP